MAWRAIRRRSNYSTRPTVLPRPRRRRSPHGSKKMRGVRQDRQPHAGAGRIDRSRASYRADAHGLGKRLPGAAGLGEALHDLLPVPGCGVPERDPAVEIDPFERTGRRIALSPPRIGQVLLRCVRDGARPQDEGETARSDDDCFQRRRGGRLDQICVTRPACSRRGRRSQSAHTFP